MLTQEAIFIIQADTFTNFQEKVATSSPHIIETLREAAKPNGKPSLWLSDLPDDKLLEVYHRLRSGQTLNKIIRIVRDNWRIRTDMNSKSMSNSLSEFRKRVLSDLDQLKVIPKEADTPEKARKEVIKKAKNIKKKLDAMEMLADSIDMQFGRFVSQVAFEEANGITHLHANKTFELLTSALSTYAEKQMKLGILEVKPSELNIHLRQRFEHIVGKLDDGGVKMLEMAHNFLDIAEDECVTMKELPDGTYALTGQANCEES